MQEVGNLPTPKMLQHHGNFVLQHRGNQIPLLHHLNCRIWQDSQLGKFLLSGGLETT